MSIAARYAGVCPECELPWAPGDMIRTIGEGRVWVHTVCPYEVEKPSLHPVCQTCFLEHPEGECDR